MRSILVLAASAALAVGQAAPASAAPAKSTRDVCTFAVEATLRPGLSLIQQRRVSWIATGAITCLGSPSGVPGAITGGTYRSEGSLLATCLEGAGTEKFTASFTRSEGGTEVVEGSRRIGMKVLLGAVSGETSGGLVQFLPTGGNCLQGPVTSAMITGVLTFPNL